MMTPTRVLMHAAASHARGRIAQHSSGVLAYLWRIRWVLLFVCALLFILALVFRELGVMVAPPTAPDMFAYYAPVMPGQSVSALGAYPCQRPSSMAYPSGINVVCTMHAQEETVERITISAEDSTITRTTFHLEGVRVIDLLSRWGRPDHVLQRPDTRYEFCWAQGIYAQTAPTHWFTPQVAIRLVSMTLSAEVQAVEIKEADPTVCPTR